MLLTASVRGIAAQPIAVRAEPAGSPHVLGARAESTRETMIRVRSALLARREESTLPSVCVSLDPPSPQWLAPCDLAIALAFVADERIEDPARFDGHLFFGELSLAGELRACRGLVPVLTYCRDAGITAVIPWCQRAEAALVHGANVKLAHNIGEVIDYCNGQIDLPAPGLHALSVTAGEPDMADVQGLESVKRALEIAAAGGHSICLTGPPGSGRTMLARRLGSILPMPTMGEGLEIASIQSTAGMSRNLGLGPIARPFRAPHHTASDAALVGDKRGRLGEVTLAHHGVLFLDEMTEFRHSTIRETFAAVERGTVARFESNRSWAYDIPAAPMLVGAAHLCACGLAGSTRPCVCTMACETYDRRLAELRKRFDLRVRVEGTFPLATQRERSDTPETSATIRARVTAARERLAAGAVESRSENRSRKALEIGERTFRVAQTIAALAGSAKVTEAHMAEAATLTA